MPKFIYVYFLMSRIRDEKYIFFKKEILGSGGVGNISKRIKTHSGTFSHVMWIPFRELGCILIVHASNIYIY